MTPITHNNLVIKDEELQRYIKDEEITSHHVKKDTTGYWRILEDETVSRKVSTKQEGRTIATNKARDNLPSVVIIEDTNGELYDFHLYT